MADFLLNRVTRYLAADASAVLNKNAIERGTLSKVRINPHHVTVMNEVFVVPLESNYLADVKLASQMVCRAIGNAYSDTNAIEPAVFDFSCSYPPPKHLGGSAEEAPVAMTIAARLSRRKRNALVIQFVTRDAEHGNSICSGQQLFAITQAPNVTPDEEVLSGIHQNINLSSSSPSASSSSSSISTSTTSASSEGNSRGEEESTIREGVVVEAVASSDSTVASGIAARASTSPPVVMNKNTVIRARTSSSSFVSSSSSAKTTTTTSSAASSDYIDDAEVEAEAEGGGGGGGGEVLPGRSRVFDDASAIADSRKGSSIMSKIRLLRTDDDAAEDAVDGTHSGNAGGVSRKDTYDYETARERRQRERAVKEAAAAAEEAAASNSDASADEASAAAPTNRKKRPTPTRRSGGGSAAAGASAPTTTTNAGVEFIPFNNDDEGF